MSLSDHMYIFKLYFNKIDWNKWKTFTAWFNFIHSPICNLIKKWKIKRGLYISIPQVTERTKNIFKKYL